MEEDTERIKETEVVAAKTQVEAADQSQEPAMPVTSSHKKGQKVERSIQSQCQEEATSEVAKARQVTPHTERDVRLQYGFVPDTSVSPFRSAVQLYGTLPSEDINPLHLLPLPSNR